MTMIDVQLSARPFAGEADFPAIVELWNTCEAVDQVGEGTSVNQLRVEFADPWLDTERNVRLWEDADGALIGFGQIWTPNSADEIQSRLVYQVHPEHRQRGLESQIIAWAEERLRDLSRERGLPARLGCAVRDTQHEELALMERHGLSIERYTLVMARPLDELPEAQLPAGFTLREVSAEDGAAWVEMFNLSFIDHWNHHPLTLERWQTWFSDPDYHPELNLIAVAADGTFAAFCWAGFDPTENERTGQGLGWVHLLGTRRGFRRIGLGRGILLSGLHRLQACGMKTVRLGVDAQSLTGATRLYEAAGFDRVQTWAKFTRDLKLDAA
ncbi:MAG TPA: GNAT family N-acetyltransferase [Herpetosiphonaceae bacterium]